MGTVNRAAVFSLFLSAIFFRPAFALDVKLEAVAEGLTAPMMLVSPPDGTKRRFIVEQPLHTGADALVRRAHKPSNARRNGFRAFSHLSHDQDRLAQRRRLFLNPS